jgi:hypothetical protein
MVSQNIMAGSMWWSSQEGERVRERDGPKQVRTLKYTPPVTYFLQLGPTN